MYFVDLNINHLFPKYLTTKVQNVFRLNITANYYFIKQYLLIKLNRFSINISNWLELDSLKDKTYLHHYHLYL